jgi:hypothetical protein
MPSLINTYVAANYGRMTPQQTYGSGALYSNFGTRQLRFVKVTATTDGSTALSFADSTYGDNTGGALSAFSVAVRALQTCAEVYLIGTPGSAGFVVAVADDTDNDSDGSSHVPGSNQLIAANILASLKGGVDGKGTSPFVGGSGTVTVSTLTIGASSGVAIA